MKVEILPREGIRIDNQMIQLNSNIKNMTEVMRNEQFLQIDGRYYFCNNCIMMNTDGNNEIIEIEISRPDSTTIDLYYGNSNLFELEKKDIIDLFEKANGAPVLYEGGVYEVQSLKLSFSFGMNEEEVEEMIREARNEGVYEAMKEDIEKDIYRSQHMETICLCAN